MLSVTYSNLAPDFREIGNVTSGRSKSVRAIYAAAVTYQLDGRQYVVIPSGSTLFAFALPQP